MQFEEASRLFAVYINSLAGETESKIPQAQEMLDGVRGPLQGATKEQSAEYCLRGIEKRLSDVNALYNELLKSLGFGPAL